MEIKNKLIYERGNLKSRRPGKGEMELFPVIIVVNLSCYQNAYIACKVFTDSDIAFALSCFKSVSDQAD